AGIAVHLEHREVGAAGDRRVLGEDDPLLLLGEIDFLGEEGLVDLHRRARRPRGGGGLGRARAGPGPPAGGSPAHPAGAPAAEEGEGPPCGEAGDEDQLAERRPPVDAGQDEVLLGTETRPGEVEVPVDERRDLGRSEAGQGLRHVPSLSLYRPAESLSSHSSARAATFPTMKASSSLCSQSTGSTWLTRIEPFPSRVKKAPSMPTLASRSF